MKTFILNKTLPDVHAHHKKLKGLFEYFDGFNIEDNVITVELTVDATEEIIAAINAVEVDPLPLPDVTPRQIRQALFMAGVTEQMIDAALATLPEPQKTMATIEWKNSTAFHRNRPLVSAVGSMLGWTSEQLDELWTLAGTL